MILLVFSKYMMCVHFLDGKLKTHIQFTYIDAYDLQLTKDRKIGRNSHTLQSYLVLYFFIIYSWKWFFKFEKYREFEFWTEFERLSEFMIV